MIFNGLVREIRDDTKGREPCPGYTTLVLESGSDRPAVICTSRVKKLWQFQIGDAVKVDAPFKELRLYDRQFELVYEAGSIRRQEAHERGVETALSGRTY